MNTETLQLAIIALIAGMSVPLLVQLFLTARTVQRVAASADRKLEEARRELHDLIAGSRREPATAEWTAVLASAAMPAIVAAVRSFRASVASETQNRANSNGGAVDETRESAARVPRSPTAGTGASVAR
jgi:hypothetical protein